MARRPQLAFDPVEEAGRLWHQRWPAADAMVVATSVMRVQQLLLARIEDLLRPFGLTFARYEALVLLTFSRRGALPMSRMGERLMIHPTSVTNIVDRLDGQGFTRRVPSVSDRRTTLVEITGAGRRIVEEATQAVTGARFGLADLATDELASLYDLMRGIRAAAGDFPAGDEQVHWTELFGGR